MRILIDECLDWRLCRALIKHECSSVRDDGWEGLTNGRLLEEADKQFDVFLTGDRNLRFQQNLSKLKIAVIVLETRSTRLADTIQLIPLVSQFLRQSVPVRFYALFQSPELSLNVLTRLRRGGSRGGRGLRASLRC